MLKFPDKYLLIVLLLVLINTAAVFYMFGFQKFGDSDSYIYLVDWFLGKENQIIVEGGPNISAYILRPLIALLAAPFQELSRGLGIIIQNVLFYFLGAYLVFRITDLIYKNKEQAMFASILYAFAIPWLNVGLGYMTNAGAWFFVIFSIYLTLLYFKKPSEKLLILGGLVSGAGMLLKETGGLGVLFFATALLLSKNFSFSEKFSKMLKFGVFFLIPPVIWEIIVIIFFPPFSHAYLFLVLKKDIIDGASKIKILLALKQATAFLATFGLLGWSLILFGAWKEWKEKNPERARIILAFVPFSLIFLAWWAVGDARHAFTTLGPLVLFGSYALVRLKNAFRNKALGTIVTIFVICFYIVLNHYSNIVDDAVPFIDLNDIYYFLTKS